ncbi:hypothetical protein MAJ_10355, partial [Metarhizium majus ARSEF 297]
MADDEAASFLETEKNSRKILIELPPAKPSYRVHDVRAVPETYWNAHERYFSVRGLSSFTCFVRFSITSIVSPPYGATTEETTSFILVCDLATGPDFRISLYAQTGLQSSVQPGEFIDPFADIDQYGPLGDAFSLSILRPGDREDRRVSMIHKDRRHNYTVSAGLCTSQTPSFHVTVGVEQKNTDEVFGLASAAIGADFRRRHREDISAV